MIHNQKTNQNITTTHEELTTINHLLTEYLQELSNNKNISLTQPDREAIRKIRDKNLETIQFIDHMSYTWECELK